MSEPYDTIPCPFCDSTRTLEWTRPTAWRLGYGRECLSCGTRWNFPAASDITELHPVGWSIASAAYASSRPSWPAGGDPS